MMVIVVSYIVNRALDLIVNTQCVVFRFIFIFIFLRNFCNVC